LNEYFSFLSSLINRTGQRLPFQQTEIDIPEGVPWSEIDRRNRGVLYPNNGKDSFESQDSLTTINYKRNYLELESDNNYYRRRRAFSQQNNEYVLDNSPFHFQKLLDTRTPLTSTNNDSLLLYGNSIIKSNKADILNILDQQLINNPNRNSFVNQHGVIINEDGPFWPCDFRILHPTPRLFIREITPKELYLPVTNSSSTSK